MYIYLDFTNTKNIMDAYANFETCKSLGQVIDRASSRVIGGVNLQEKHCDFQEATKAWDIYNGSDKCGEIYFTENILKFVTEIVYVFKATNEDDQFKHTMANKVKRLQ